LNRVAPPHEAEGIVTARPFASNGQDDHYIPPGVAPKFDGPAPDRENLRLAAWRKRQLPPRDYLLGDLLCTTSRCLLIGETGVGKTLFALDLAGAIAAGANVFGWEGRRPARVMYLDGELPAETFQERLELIAVQYGDDIDLYGYNRDVLTQDDMPPLNTEAGRKWLWREIEAVKPDIIFLDAIMCLLGGSMSEEESWAPVKELCRQISARRIAQVWLHHTGHDTTKGFGTKTREWEMDLVIMLSKIEGEDDDQAMAASFQLEFKKARNRTPSNYKQFATRTIRRLEQGFVVGDAAPSSKAKASTGQTETAILKRAIIETYDRLADDVLSTPGFDGKPVKKIRVEALRDELKSRGFLDVSDKGQVTPRARQLFGRVKSNLLLNDFSEQDSLIWRNR